MLTFDEFRKVLRMSKNLCTLLKMTNIRDVVSFLKSEAAHLYWALFREKSGGTKPLFTLIWQKKRGPPCPLGDFIPEYFWYRYYFKHFFKIPEFWWEFLRSTAQKSDSFDQWSLFFCSRCNNNLLFPCRKEMICQDLNVPILIYLFDALI